MGRRFLDQAVDFAALIFKTEKETPDMKPKSPSPLARTAGVMTLWIGLILGLTVTSMATLVWAFYYLGVHVVSPPVVLISISFVCGLLAWLTFNILGGRISLL